MKATDAAGKPATDAEDSRAQEKGPGISPAVSHGPHAFTGKSSIAGKAAAPPAFSWSAAWAFAVGYFKAVWVALLAALLIASGIEALLPRRWLVRLLISGPRLLGGAAAGGYWPFRP